MVQDHAPAVRGFLENVGRQNRRREVLPLNRAVQVFIERHPGNLAAHLNIHVGQSELHGWGVVKYPFPTLHHRAPTAQDAPARMPALDIGILGPDLLHGIDFKALEGSIKSLVRLSDCLDFVGHSHLSSAALTQVAIAVLTRINFDLSAWNFKPRIRVLVMRFRRYEHQRYQTRLAAIGDAMALPSGRQGDLPC